MVLVTENQKNVLFKKKKRLAITDHTCWEPAACNVNIWQPVFCRVHIFKSFYKMFDPFSNGQLAGYRLVGVFIKCLSLFTK